MHLESKPEAQIKIRLDEGLKTWLKHQAVDNRRSLNGELVHRLEQSRRTEEQKSANQT